MERGRPYTSKATVSTRASLTVVRVRYAETDRMGVAYYANYLVWFEVARTDWLRAAGVSYRDVEASGIILPVIEAHCEYRQPAHYDDEIEIRTRGALHSPVRVEFRYELIRRLDQAILATGRTVHASTDPDGRPRRLPERVRMLFT